MKTPTCLVVLAAGWALISQSVQADNPTVPVAQPTQSDHPAAPAAQPAQPDQSVAPAAPPAAADNPVVPGAGFAASRYEALWTKSPFAVATSEETVDSSPDYTFVGFYTVEGISYASVVETKPPQEHFLISTDKSTRGLMLTSITRSHDGADTFANVKKDGQPITLKLQDLAATTAPAAVMVSLGGTMTPQIPMPGSMGSARPLTRFHRSLINLPPRPGQQQQSMQAPPARPPQPIP